MSLTFSTFWHGPEISAMEMACMSSFTQRGHKVYLFCYDRPVAIPDGVELMDAQEVAPKELLDKFIVFGKPSIAHFSDYFRLLLFRNFETIWIDTDVVLLKKEFDWPPNKLLVAKEDDSGICNAVMHFPSKDSDLANLIQQAGEMAGKPIAYGATGKLLIEGYYGQKNLLARAPDPDIFYPVHYKDFWKVFLPKYREECEMLCQNASTLHLWNNLVVKSGIWKNIAPPSGSFLETAFTDAGVMHYFKLQYPENVVRTMLQNYFATDGSDLGLVRLAKQFVPSINRSIKRHILKQSSDILESQKTVSFLSTHTSIKKN